MINYPIYAVVTAVLWIIGAVMMFFDARKSKLFAHIFMVSGILTFSCFITLLWMYLQRPPLRTLGETRLWYAFFFSALGYIIYVRWRYIIVLWLSIAIALLCLWINLEHPENFEKNLMPALQSPWFVPHVIVYILSYAFLGFSWLIAIIAMFVKAKEDYLRLADNLVYIGFALLTQGMTFGALWAKEAWGHYWTWDPKETWAFLTWLVYLAYIHYRYDRPQQKKAHLWMLSLIFVVLLVCWFGLSYLPAAQNSVHVYGQ
jgi:ABC-type transport system involved in cytochrome c biogenesis permease subunit